MPKIEEFIAMPYNKQLHLCVLGWLVNQHIHPYRDGKLVREYFVCRTHLLKKDRQTIKNIALMLFETTEIVPLYELERKAALFIRAQQLEAEKAARTARKEYHIDLAQFLRS